MELSISEAAQRTGLSAHTLRYYERNGLMLDVGRAPSGHRRYRAQDLEWLRLITRLRSTGMPIRDVRRYADLVRAGHGNEAERLALLRAHRVRVAADLAETRAHLEAIDVKTPATSGRWSGPPAEPLTSSALEGEGWRHDPHT